MATMRPFKFKRIITGHRCNEIRCYSVAVWYIETEAEFFHWCPKHAVTHMRDTRFWKKRIQEAAEADKLSLRRSSGSSAIH